MADEKNLCPLKYLANSFGGKWKLPVICVLANQKPQRYSAIKKRIGGITNTMLAKTLRELEDLGYVNRKEYDEKVPHVEYSLTVKGEGALPMLTAAAEWAIKEMANENLKPYCSECNSL